MQDNAPTFLSLFSGIGGFDLGLQRAGWRCAGQVEIDGFCNRVLARHWPDTPRWRDIRHLTFAHAAGQQLPEWAGPLRVDLLCGGFPCQDLSVAGRRAGLAGARSGLFFEFVRVAAELRPRWLLLENVPGLLSSNGGRDFALVLAALGDAGYGVGWRVLDARWFGVPQRRRRVFLVGRLGVPCPPEVLFEPEGVPGHPAPGGEAGAGVAYSLGRGTDRFGEGPGPWSTNYVVEDEDTLATGPTRRYRKGPDSDATDTLVAWAISDKPEPKVLQGQTPPLDRNGGASGRAMSVAYTTKLHNTQSNQAGKLYEDYSPSLQEHSPAPAALYYSHDYNQDRVYDPEGISPAVTSQDSSGARQFLTGAAVRRLTPTECERLQAFPDGWSCLCGVEPYSTWTCRCPDGPRYAALGNAVTTTVVEWIGRRLMRHSGTYGA